MDPDSPEARLEGFLAEFDEEIADLARAALHRLRLRLPGAVQLVYDNYNALVVGFGPGERASDAVFSVAVYPRWVNLFFLRGASLPDPHGLLQGEGSQVRHVRLREPADVGRPEVGELVERALCQAGWEPRAGEPGSLEVRAVSPCRRPRRPRR